MSDCCIRLISFGYKIDEIYESWHVLVNEWNKMYPNNPVKECEE